MSDWYVLDDQRIPVKVGDMLDAAKIRMRQKIAEEYRVGDTTIAPGVRVSTVFLGLDHQFYDGPPLVFETMVFARGWPFDEECERYSTWDEAETGHAAVCAEIASYVASHPNGATEQAE